MTDLALKLVSITCLDKQDSGVNGRDEVKLTFNGRTIWSDNSFGTGDTRNLSHLGSFNFVDKATLDAFEEDNWPDRDDHLGGRIVSAADVGGEFMIDFKLNGGHYHVYADVNNR